MNTTKAIQPGDLVWIETIKTGDPKADNSYYDGEYLVLRASAASVTAVKPEAGYGGHTTKAFSTRTHTIEWTETSEAFVRGFVADLEAFAEAGEDERRWNSSVYTGAASIARQFRRIIATRWPEASVVPPELTINGVRYVAAINPTQEVTS